MTDRYAVIGNPIAHSKSPALHAAFARQCGQDIRYEAILGPLDGFRAAVEAFRQAGGRGMNVTVPFKVEALALADILTERARLARSAGRVLHRQARNAGHRDHRDLAFALVHHHRPDQVGRGEDALADQAADPVGLTQAAKTQGGVGGEGGQAHEPAL